MPDTSTFGGVPGAVEASRPASHASALRKKSRLALARETSAPSTAKAASPTTTMRVGLSAMSLRWPAPRSTAAARTSGPAGSVVASCVQGRCAMSDSPHAAASVLTSGVNTVFSPPTFSTASSGTASWNTTAAPARGRTTSWLPKAEATRSEPSSVRGETTVNGRVPSPQPGSRDATPAVRALAEIRTRRRPPRRRYESICVSSAAENGMRAPATTSTPQSSGMAGVSVGASGLMS